MPFDGTTADGCNPDVRVIVGDVEVPTVGEGATVTVRKDGPADVVRETTAQVPIRWGEEDVAEAVNGLSGGTPRRQHASVELIDPYASTDDETVYTPIHHGFVAAAGGHADRGAAQFRIADFAQLLGDIPASVTFEENASLRTVLEYVRQTLIEGQSVIDDLSFAVRNITPDTEVDDDRFETTGVDEEQGEAVQAFLEGETVAEEDVASGDLDAATETFEEGVVRELGNLLGIFSFDALATPTSFSADRDTLVDVLNWVDRHHNIRWYFLPLEATSTPTLVIDGNPTTATLHDENHLDGEPGSQAVRILENAALTQISPPHRLTARGRTASLTETPMTWLTEEGGPGKYPTATVTSDELDARTDVEEAPQEIEVDTISLEKTENVAKSELKDRLDGAAGGQMTLPPTPSLRPYSRLDALPVCGSEAITDLPAVSYEIEEVIHYGVTAQQDKDPGSPRTVVRCGVFVDPEEISVVESNYHDA